MESIRYLRALLRSWWLVLLVVLASGAGGYYVYHQTTPLYQSATRLIVASETPGTDPVSAKALASARAISLASIATTPPAVEDALRQARRLPNDTLSVTASAVDQTFTIAVSDSDPQLARDVAAAYRLSITNSENRLAGVTGTPFRLNVLYEPAVSTVPYAPNWQNDIGLGLAAGLVIGLAIAVLRETFNRTVRDSDALRDLTGLTVLGTVPKDMARKHLPARSDPRSPRAEAYRQIRTTLLSRTTERPLVLSVTSATLGEGKTSVAANLAAILSRAGHSVALVDADMRRPRVHTFYEIDPEFGLSEVLSGVARLDEAVVELDDGTLTVLTAGRIPTDPAELLAGQAMVDTLATLATDREFVIIDTPPVLPVTDALIVAPLTHGVIFVSKLQGSTDDRILRAIEGIDRVNGTILGIVPNQATMGADRDYSYSYRYAPTRRRSDRRSSGRRTSDDLVADRRRLDDADDRNPQDRDAEDHHADERRSAGATAVAPAAVAEVADPAAPAPTHAAVEQVPVDVQDGELDFAEFGGDHDVLDERTSPIHVQDGQGDVHPDDLDDDDDDRDGGLAWLDGSDDDYADQDYADQVYAGQDFADQAYATENHASGNHATENHATENHASGNHATENHATENHASRNHATENHASEDPTAAGHASDRYAADDYVTDDHVTDDHAADSVLDDDAEINGSDGHHDGTEQPAATAGATRRASGAARRANQRSGKRPRRQRRG